MKRPGREASIETGRVNVGAREPGKLSKILSSVLCVGLVPVIGGPEAPSRPAVAAQAQAPTGPRITLDFETGDLRGWTATGTAFAGQPTMGDNSLARGGAPAGHQGRFWIGTFENHPQGSTDPGGAQGERPQGTLESTPFEVPAGTLSFLVGGGSAFETRVELRLLDPIEGPIRVAFASGTGIDTMRRETWDLSSWIGRQAQLRIVDESSAPGGHINADDFRFSARTQQQGGATRPPTLVPVPGVVGSEERAALEQLRAARLEGQVVDRRESDRPRGTVIRQAPAAGAQAAPGSVVELIVAIPRTARVPDVTGQPEAAARRMLEAAGLRAGTVATRETRDPPGTVVDQKVPADERVELGTAVDLEVAVPLRVEVPNLIDTPESEARRQLEEAELVVGAVVTVESRRQSGIVVSQSERAGRRVVIGTVVDLVVSTPVTVELPDLSGRSRSEAQGLLEGLELLVGNVTTQESREPVDSVLSQRPGAGSRAAINTNVDLVIAEPVTVLVPDLVGLSEGVARQRLADTELVGGQTVGRESRQQTGSVLAQGTDPGVRVAIGTPVDLVLAIPVTVVVPEVVGRSETEAASVLAATELVLGEVSHQESAARPGTVLTQSLNPGTRAQVGSAVNLLVAVVETVEVPNLVGRPVDEARRELVVGRLEVGTEEPRETRTEPEGAIMEQSREAGTRAAVGTPINLVVATPEIVTVPELEGLTQEAALAAISGAGLVAGVISEAVSIRPGGTVLAQNQPAGSQIVFSTPIDLRIARSRAVWAIPLALLFVVVAGVAVARRSPRRKGRRDDRSPPGRAPKRGPGPVAEPDLGLDLKPDAGPVTGPDLGLDLRPDRDPDSEPDADTESPDADISVRPLADPGRQKLEHGAGDDFALEIRLRPRVDPGIQEIEAPEDLIAGERRDDE